MKKICLLSMCVLLLCGCERSYEEAKTTKKDFGHGYFTEVKSWETSNANFYILYANDTKVMYLVINGYRKFGITPLYNADGSLQVYDGK